jgi:anti-sigma regulatory factor (Ser/Thr protein kinase)
MPEKSRQALDMLIAEVDRFQQMVKELLEISAMDAGAAVPNIEPTNAATLIRHLSDTFIAPGIPVGIAPELENLEIFVDRHRIERVFANLIENANQHSDGLSEVSAGRNGGYIRISVTDRGPGIPADQRQAIFERFYRGRAAGRRGKSTGTGLGLALVLEHMKLHRGTVSVEVSNRGENTFIIEIPVQPSDAWGAGGIGGIDGGGAGGIGGVDGGDADGATDVAGGGSGGGDGAGGSEKTTADGNRERATGGKRKALKMAVAALSALLLGSCAVITQNKPTTLSRKSIPFGLMNKTPASFPVPQKNAPVEVPATIFLVAPDGRLWPAGRDISFPSSIDSLLAALVDGPTKPETLYGLSTAIPAQVGSLSAKTTGSTAVVNLAPTFGTLSGSAQIQATAQIVFTATTLPGIINVTFRMNGAAIDVPNALGALLPGPVTRSDYTPLAPLPPSATTAAHTSVATHTPVSTHASAATHSASGQE